VRQSIVPTSPVADRPPTSFVTRRRYDDDGTIERHEELTSSCRMQADKRIDRLPFGLLAVDTVEVLDTTIANRRVYAFVVNDLRTARRYVIKLTVIIITTVVHLIINMVI